MKLSYILIPTAIIAVVALASYFVSLGVGGWYESLSLPAAAPQDSTISTVWTCIYALATLSFLAVYNGPQYRTRRGPDVWLRLIIGLFAANGFLNVFWCYLFFVAHELFLSFICACALAVSAATLLAAILPRQRMAAVFLVPYVVWVFFAAYLTYAIAALN